MALATVTFWGENISSYGVPKTLHTYLISVSVNQALGNRDKIVKIVPLSEGAPKPIRDLPFIIKNSDWKKAIFEAFCLLEGMDCFKGLRNHKSIVEMEKQGNLLAASA
ncbi:MAG: hypothetical protein OEM46_10005 [Ignavibacteria bacterium]|nr:hypothetical protein [Ignavibacteria bacterium]